jgi:penicillin-binding protein 1A
VLDRKGERFAEVFEKNQRRVWVPLVDIPEHVQKAFIAAEDKRFYQHKGIDERGLIRAFIGNLASSGRPQGGSTITQQTVKNLLVGEDLTYERKIREVIVASRIERTLSKAAILELYLNSVYLGRSFWGIEMAARGYFGKPAKELTLEEGALLAGLTNGPNYFNPDRHLAVRRSGWPMFSALAGGRSGRRRAAWARTATITGVRTLRTSAPRHRLPLRRSGRP